MAEDSVAALVAVLDGAVTKEDAAELLRRTDGDVNAAISLHFDGIGLDDPVQSEAAPRSEEGDTDSRSSPPLDELSSTSTDPSTETASHRRRPGTAPITRHDQQRDLQTEIEALQSVLGEHISEDKLRQLLLMSGGSVELALEMHFMMSDQFSHSAAGDLAGLFPHPHAAAADGDDGEGGDQLSGSVPANTLQAPGAPIRPLAPRPTLGEGRPQPPPRRGGQRGGSEEDDAMRVRRPYEDLAAMIGSGVDPAVLAPIMVETKGDVSQAVELYLERVHTLPPPSRPKTDQEAAEEYYLRPPEPGAPVYCNVYDLSWGGGDEKDGKKKKPAVNSGLPGMGLGIYHSGIEIYGREISFGYSDDDSTGVFEVPGKCAGGVMAKITFKESVLMGHCHKSRYELDQLLRNMAESYRGDTYDLLRRNCNHFANDLCVRLTGKKIPSYINRPANVGRVAVNIFSGPAVAIGKLVDGVKKVKKGKEEGPNRPVVAAPSAARLLAGPGDSAAGGSDSGSPAAAAAAGSAQGGPPPAAAGSNGSAGAARQGVDGRREFYSQPHPSQTASASAGGDAGGSGSSGRADGGDPSRNKDEWMY